MSLHTINVRRCFLTSYRTSVLLWKIIVWSFNLSPALLMLTRVFPPWFSIIIHFFPFIKLVPCSHWKKSVWLRWRQLNLLALILPPRSMLLVNHPRAPTATLEIAPIFTTLRIGVGIAVTTMVLTLTAHQALLLGSCNSHIPLISSGVGLCHCGSCLCARIIPLYGLAHMLLPSNRAL